MDIIQHLFRFLTGIEPEEPEPPKPVTYFMPPKLPAAKPPAPDAAPKQDSVPPVSAPMPEPDTEREALAEQLSEIPFEQYAGDSHEAFAAMLRQYLTDESLIAQILAARTPCIPLATKETDEAAIPVGASRMGGTTADLPPGIDYPTMCGYHSVTRAQWLRDDNGNPINERVETYAESAMQLMLQLNLAEIPDTAGLLPPRGMLWIFWSGELIDLMQHKKWTEENGGEMTLYGENTELFKVFYDPGIEPLVRKSAPCPPYARSFDEPLPSRRVTPGEVLYDLDPQVFDFEDYDLDSNDSTNVYGEKLFGIPTYCCNANPPGKEEQNLYQSSYHQGCLEGVWWYQKKGAFLQGISMECDVD